MISIRIQGFVVGLVVMLFGVTGAVSVGQEPDVVDFERHVAPLLGRLGCNSAACHGAFGGKGGLQMSLFGYSAKLDYDQLIQRIDDEDPDESLFLLKPSGGEAHEGGVRFDVDSDTYRTVRQWVAEGAHWRAGSGVLANLSVSPTQVTFGQLNQGSDSDPVSLKVVAEFRDGTQEDVTHLCQFRSQDEGIATVSEQGQVAAVRYGDTSVVVSYSGRFASIGVWVPYPSLASESTFLKSNEIDRLVNIKLRQLNIPCSPLSSDEEFLRRVTLDTIGKLPSAEEVLEFCQQKSPDKREQLIDRLLSHPSHATLWASRMCEITKCKVELVGQSDDVNVKFGQLWHGWFQKRFSENLPYDQMVRGVIEATSRGDQSVSQWMIGEERMIREELKTSRSDYSQREYLDLYWRRLDDKGQFPLEDMSELTAAAFLGIRMNCARCHKHPFDRWSQDEYASYANIFSQVVYGGSTDLNAAVFAELDRRRQSKSQGKNSAPLPKMWEVFNNEQFGKKMVGSSSESDVSPRPPGGAKLDSTKPLRKQFSDWLTAPENPYFARSFANRIWSVYFGRGIVNPVDDFSVSNSPSHPQLLDWLEESFLESGFDIRRLEKTILMSAAYQRTSTPNGANRDDLKNYSRQQLRPFMAEVALDIINEALGVQESLDPALEKGTLAIELGSSEIRGSAAKVLRVFGRGQRQSVCDCDRRTEPDMRQSLMLLNDPVIQAKISKGSIQALRDLDDEALVSQLYLRLLSRKPDQTEMAIAREYLNGATGRELAFNELVWSLINTREFIVNH